MADVDKALEVTSREPLFDYSMLHEVPKVPQFDLPRYEPPRGVSKRALDVTSDPNVREGMLRTIMAGQKMGGDKWYNAEPLRQHFTRVLGEEGGNKAFRKYMDFVAATSPRSKVDANVRNASYYYAKAMRGEPMPEVGEKNPQPYGHLAQRLHQMNAQRVHGPGWEPLTNPKPASFVENLAGNQMPGTIDTHAFRLPAIIGKDPRFLDPRYVSSKDAPIRNIQKEVESGQMSMDEAAKHGSLWQSVPKDNEYAHMEQFYRELGRELGMTTAQTQASAWVGGGHMTGLGSDESKPFIRFLDDRVHVTAAKRGMDPKDVLDKFIRGELELFRDGGAVHGALEKTAGL